MPPHSPQCKIQMPRRRAAAPPRLVVKKVGKRFGGLPFFYYFCMHETCSDFSPVHLDHQHAQGLSRTDPRRTEPEVDRICAFRNQHNDFLWEQLRLVWFNEIYLRDRQKLLICQTFLHNFTIFPPNCNYFPNFFVSLQSTTANCSKLHSLRQVP